MPHMHIVDDVEWSPPLEDLQGCHATNDDMAESVFGAYTYERRWLPGISQRRASGLAQSRIMKNLSRADAVRHRAPRCKNMEGKKRRKRCYATSQTFGYFHRLPHAEAVALVEMARRERGRQRALDRDDHEELDAFRAARRKSNSELELQSLIKQFAVGLSFFDQYQASLCANSNLVFSTAYTCAKSLSSGERRQDGSGHAG